MFQNAREINTKDWGKDSRKNGFPEARIQWTESAIHYCLGDNLIFYKIGLFLLHKVIF